MQRSNSYIIIFTVLLTVICAGLLAGVAEALKPEHKKQIELDRKSQILGAVMSGVAKEDVQEIYANRIVSIVVDVNGNEVPGVKAEDVNVLAQYKKKNDADKLFPVFKLVNESNKDQIDAYILPMYGNGLWDLIWGFVAVDNDLHTIKGAVFAHKGETPGLGARITDSKESTGKETAFQERFKGRQFVVDGKFVGLEVLKGEKNVIPDADKNSIDGLSGASMTTGGLNVMLDDYLKYYSAYFNNIKG